MSIDAIKAVFERSASSGSDRVMLLAIAEHLNDKGPCWPSMDRLARMCNTSPRQAIRLVENLRLLGELEVQRCAGPRGANLYRITLPTPDTHVTPDTYVTPEAGVTPDTHVTPDTQGIGGDIQGSSPLTRMSPKPPMNPKEPPSTSKLPLCPHNAVVDLFHEALPELPRVRLMEGKRKTAIKSFWTWVLQSRKSDGTRRAETADQALQWVRGYFKRTRSNDFLMGRTARSEAHSNWKCDLDYLLTERGRKQVIEKTEEAHS